MFHYQPYESRVFCLNDNEELSIHIILFIFWLLYCVCRSNLNHDVIYLNFVFFLLHFFCYRLNEYDTEVNIPQIIEKCIEKLLSYQLKELYEDLAIFEQDVNIPSSVLEILWDKPSFVVRNIMNKFAEKSLIVPFYHNDLQTNIYGIHDIHLNYLKNVTNAKEVHLHRKLISGYDRITGGNYTNLPDDNYSFQFIGYHLFHAEDFEKFHIYFDLKFLECKLRAVGKEDVLRDMQKYQVYITRNVSQFCYLL